MQDWEADGRRTELLFNLAVSQVGPKLLSEKNT